ncbi:MAG: CSLREA domain-containing protein [Acidobacteriota bacterium]
MRKYFFTLVLLSGISCLPLCINIWLDKTVFSQQDIANTTTPGRITVHATNHGNPTINLYDGVELSADYSQATNLQQLLKQGTSQPCALNSADFNEDGVPDLIVGYAQSKGGILSLYPGNIDSIYPNSSEAQQRKATGQFDNAAFLPSARLFELDQVPDFLAAGDFDADGHWDIVAAMRGSRSLFFLPGDGKGSFGAARRIKLPAAATALLSGEINRPDGLADIVIGVTSDTDSKVMVYESPEGAMNAKPEIFSFDSEITGLALGQFDEQYEMDLAIAAGSELAVVHGRDRRLSLDANQQAEVAHATIDRHSFAFKIKSIAAGDFIGNQKAEIAMLSSDGTGFLFDITQAQNNQGNVSRKRKAELTAIQAIGKWKGAIGLLCAHISSGSADDLLVLDRASRQLHILTSGNSGATALSLSSSLRADTLLDVEGEPVAALPMRLNGDALSDLVILQTGSIAPAIVKTAAAMTFTVNKTDDHDDGVCDSGDCTLREAINTANLNPGADVIAFAINSGVQTITLSTDLPIITDPVTIDGTTQPGFVGSPIIEINGTNARNRAGFSITGGNSVMRGFVLNRFNTAAIGLGTSGYNRIEGNYIGTDINGTTRMFNGIGVSIFRVSNNVVGGTTSVTRNVISGNAGNGIEIFNDGADANLIQGNYIGTNAAGATGLSNTGEAGVLIGGNRNNQVGGTAPGAGNVISGNGRYGIELGGFGGHLVQGNLIGTNAAGTSAIPNSEAGIHILNAPNLTIGGTIIGARNIISGNISCGIKITETGSRGNLIQGNYIGTAIDGITPLPNCTFTAGNSIGGIFISRGSDNTVGGVVSGAGNIIAFNGVVGVIVINDPGFVNNTGNTIRKNSIFSNNGPGIDLTPFGVTTNDACDVDTGANNLQNFPVLTSATSNGITTTIQGTLNSTASTTFTLEFFANDNCDSSGFGEGQTFIGSATVTTDGDCNASFNVTLPAAVHAGQVITATAIDPAGNTSEFSQCAPVSQGSSFTLCLQDDSNGNVLLVNSTTGDYLFTNCNGVIFSGIGAIISRGCTVTLQHYAADRRVLAQIDTCAKRGTASIQWLSQATTFSIIDRSTTNNTCACPTE